MMLSACSYVLVTQKKTKICPCVEEIKWHPTVCVEKCNHLFFRERLPVAITRDVAAQRNVWASTIRQKRRCFCFGPYDGPQVQRANRWTPVRPPSISLLPLSPEPEARHSGGGGRHGRSPPPRLPNLHPTPSPPALLRLPPSSPPAPPALPLHP
jgi:hypothetical protein